MYRRITHGRQAISGRRLCMQSAKVAVQVSSSVLVDDCRYVHVSFIAVLCFGSFPYTMHWVHGCHKWSQCSMLSNFSRVGTLPSSSSNIQYTILWPLTIPVANACTMSKWWKILLCSVHQQIAGNCTFLRHKLHWGFVREHCEHVKWELFGEMVGDMTTVAVNH